LCLSVSVSNELLTESLLEFCSGVIGFLLCAKEGPSVNFLTPINPIEKVEGATKAGREIRFYNSEVRFLNQSYRICLANIFYVEKRNYVYA